MNLNRKIHTGKKPGSRLKIQTDGGMSFKIPTGYKVEMRNEQFF